MWKGACACKAPRAPKPVTAVRKPLVRPKFYLWRIFMKKTIFFAGFFIFAANFFFSADEGRKCVFKYREGVFFCLLSTFYDTV